MAKNIPITIRKIEKTEADKKYLIRNREEYLFQINEKQTDWELSKIVDKDDLLNLRDEINTILGLKTFSEKMSCSIEQAESILKYQSKEKICENCRQKNISCYDCIYTCQSPLEQKLLIALKDVNLETELQRRISKDGTGYTKEFSVDKKTILTLPDFYIESSNKKICIYADGHTYHERTEHQALRDRNIDRELQNLGFVVLRFTGKEIRENIEKVIETIKNSLELKPVAV